MKKLARWASWYSSPYPLRGVVSEGWGALCRFLALTFAIVTFSAGLIVGAFAAAAPPVPPSVLDTISALWGPTCGLLVALVVLCERIARVIPNSTSSQVLKALLVVTTILGIKVPDNQ